MPKLIFLLLLMTPAVVPAQETLWVGRFSAGELAPWEERSFNGHTDYALVPDPERGQVLAAVSHASASALYRRMPIDLSRTPYLNWSWKVDGVLEGVDERRKTGDDYPARVYVVVSDGPFWWQTRSLVYVWASGMPAGSTWSSAYTDKARLLALRSGPGEAGRWVSERRNVAADFRRLFGREIGQLDGVAVMTDSDDSGQQARAWYGDIGFSAQ